MEIVIRTATLSDVPDLAKLHVNTWQTAYKNIMPTEYLASLKYSDFESGWTKTLSSNDIGQVHARIVAEADNGKLVGFVGGGKQRTKIAGYDSELYGIYILVEFEGKGIARKLTKEFTKWLIEKNFRSMILWVLENNVKARGFYESIGGVLLNERKEDRQFGDKPLMEIAYGWPDLNELNSRLNKI